MFQKRHIGTDTLTICLCCFIYMLMTAGCRESSTQDAGIDGTPVRYGESTDKTIVHLYFSDRENAFLIAEERSLPAQKNPTALGIEIIESLLEGPQKALIRTIPEGTVLRAFYIMDNGIAVLDFSRHIKELQPGGVKTELMTIYSVVNSLVLNVPEIEEVKIVIEGKEAPTLAGHIDLLYPFQANMLYIR